MAVINSILKKAKKVLSNRIKNTHKGDYGHIFILSGSVGYVGAPLLTGMACLRTGAGLVTIGVPEGIYNLIARKTLEAMVRPFAQTKQQTLSLKAYKDIMNFAEGKACIAIGPGLSNNPSTQKLVLKLIKNTSIPMVVDADALGAIAARPDVLKQTKAELILTPHPGEFSRLIQKPASFIQKNREALAKSFSTHYNTVLVLKGHRTIVASSEGKTYINRTGNPGMATAGSGDVLTGMIAALIGQGFKIFEASCLGVYLHGLAGDLAVKKKTQAGLIASDIIEKIPEAIKKLNKCP